MFFLGFFRWSKVWTMEEDQVEAVCELRWAMTSANFQGVETSPVVRFKPTNRPNCKCSSLSPPPCVENCHMQRERERERERESEILNKMKHPTTTQQFFFGFFRLSPGHPGFDSRQGSFFFQFLFFFWCVVLFLFLQMCSLFLFFLFFLIIFPKKSRIIFESKEGEPQRVDLKKKKISLSLNIKNTKLIQFQKKKKKKKKKKRKKMPKTWIEHVTFRSSVWRSPSWAISAFLEKKTIFWEHRYLWRGLSDWNIEKHQKFPLLKPLFCFWVFFGIKIFSKWIFDTCLNCCDLVKALFEHKH